MKQYYESEVLFRLMERDGLNIPSSVPPYESEIKAYLINQVKQAYPKLTDYEAEWLLYNYAKHLPADFPISSVTDVTEATFENVVPYAYQNAILKGQTLVNTFKSFANYSYSASDMGVKWLIGGSAPLTETLNNDELTMTLTGVGSKVVTIDDVSMIKPNTKYMVKINYTTSFGSGINFGSINNSTIYTQIASMKSNEYVIFTTPSDLSTWVALWFGILYNLQVGDTIKISKPVLIEYQEGMENWDIPYFEGMKSVQMPVLTTTNEDGTKTNILTVNEDVTLRSNGSVYDELDLLTGKLTQRIDEDGSVLTQEVVKTVELTTVNENGESVHFIPLEGTMSVRSSGENIQPTFDMSVPVEATTQNLASFIELEMRDNDE